MHFAENASVSGVHHKPTHVVRFRKRTAVFRYNQLRIASKGNAAELLEKVQACGRCPNHECCCGGQLSTAVFSLGAIPNG